MKSARLGVVPEARVPVPERDAPWRVETPQGGTWVREGGTVDSVQWVDLPRGLPHDLAAVERAYFAWVPRLSMGVVRARAVGEGLSLGLAPLHWPIAIRLGSAEEGEGRRARGIEGGLLADPGGEIAFEVYPRAEGQRLAVAVRRLRPRLPRRLYFYAQAPLHERATFAFLRQAVRESARRAEAGDRGGA
ncbi:MAG: hypothetical protein D6731_18870 [Planctomycetota bacterium]|nr:MAG: hypothetical protein D6731_18870 [Planctomycetota bacterium]